MFDVAFGMKVKWMNLFIYWTLCWLGQCKRCYQLVLKKTTYCLSRYTLTSQHSFSWWINMWYPNTWYRTLKCCVFAFELLTLSNWVTARLSWGVMWYLKTGCRTPKCCVYEIWVKMCCNWVTPTKLMNLWLKMPVRNLTEWNSTGNLFPETTQRRG